jgi:cysteinyl-tRNA synthetase
MKLKKPVLLFLVSAIIFILLIPIEGFLPYFFITDRGFASDSNAIPVFSDDSKLVYVLQGADIKDLLKTDFDIAVVDPDDSRLNSKNLDSLQKQDKRIIAYLSIGEAEDYRSYWEEDWCAGNPSFVDEENPDWHGNYRVRFWDRQWQDIIIKRLDELVKTGYDGAYLDVIDVYEYYRDKGYIFAKIEMINFVYSISRHVKSSKEDFLIIPQNGEELLTDYVYIKSIDGIGREDIWFTDDAAVDKNATELTLKYLAGIKQNNKFVFVICYAEEEITKNMFLEFTKKYGFIPYLGKRELNTIEEF